MLVYAAVFLVGLWVACTLVSIASGVWFFALASALPLTLLVVGDIVVERRKQKGRLR